MKNKLQEERAAKQQLLHRIVVKVISWSDGLSFGGIVEEKDKIQPKEWKAYCQHLIKANLSSDKSKIKQTLAATRNKIEKFGGFA